MRGNIMSTITMRRRALAAAICSLLVLGLWAGAASAVPPSFVTFESGHVRPIALSPDGSKLFAVNTPDNTLEIFDVSGSGLTWTAAVTVGMEPVAVAPRTNTEVWVVNHLSDSVSIVDLSGAVPTVSRTLLVGDEPRDIVFAAGRAFISTAHRGQHRLHSSISGVWSGGNPADPRFTTAGIDRADVWVFSATAPGATIGGTPIDVLTFFADTPRALATDGTTVYVAAFHSGNQTTVVNETFIPDGFDTAGPSGGAPGGVPGPDDNAAGDPAPETSLIVKWDGAAWRDVDARSWNALVPWRLPDNDVFAFDAATLASGTVFSSVGTILFNMAINPNSGKVYVTNTESPNEVRFEGPGIHGSSTVQGNLSQSRVTILDPGGPSQDVQHLNQHINYNDLHTDVGANHAAINGQIAHSLATPMLPEIHSSGSPIYIPAFGSKKIGVFTQSELEDSSFESNYDPTAESADYLTTTGGGPSGAALDETIGTVNSSSSPLRSTVSAAVLPAFASATRRESWATSSMVSPLNATITSPGRSPASYEAESRSIRVTSAPFVEVAPTSAARSGVRRSTRNSIAPRCTSPYLMRSPVTWRARLLGTAKPMP